MQFLFDWPTELLLFSIEGLPFYIPNIISNKEDSNAGLCAVILTQVLTKRTI